MITFDIETLPTNDSLVIAELEKTICPPANYKKQESIDEWMVMNKGIELQKLIAKTPFDGMYGRVACIAWQRDDGNILSSNSEMDESEVIEWFYDHVLVYGDSEFCGHNICGFDLPFLKHRSIILEIQPPTKLIEAMNSKPWSGYVHDTMLMWSQDKQSRTSMNKLCRALGIEDKGEFEGSMVAETWLTDPDKVIKYCIDDVARTRAIYKRMAFL